MPRKNVGNYTSFGPATSLTTVDDIDAYRLIAQDIQTQSLRVKGIEVEEIAGSGPGGGLPIGGDLDMQSNNILNANTINAQTISAVNYDYVSSQTHTISDDQIVISNGGANQTTLSTSADGLKVDKSLNLDGVKLTMAKGQAYESSVSADPSGQIKMATGNNGVDIDGGLTVGDASLSITGVAFRNDTTQSSLNLISDRMVIPSHDFEVGSSRNIYHKGTTLQSQLDDKANQSTTYTKTEVDGIETGLQNQIDTKANQATTYTKTEVDGIETGLQNQINTKANQATTYTKVEVDGIETGLQGQIDNKANQATTYTKVEVDGIETGLQGQIDNKANQATTYTKVEVDGLVGGVTINNLNDIGDVDLTTAPTDTQVLTWVAGDGKWKAQDASGGAGGGDAVFDSVRLRPLGTTLESKLYMTNNTEGDVELTHSVGGALSLNKDLALPNTILSGFNIRDTLFESDVCQYYDFNFDATFYDNDPPSLVNNSTYYELVDSQTLRRVTGSGGLDGGALITVRPDPTNPDWSSASGISNTAGKKVYIEFRCPGATLAGGVLYFLMNDCLHAPVGVEWTSGFRVDYRAFASSGNRLVNHGVWGGSTATGFISPGVTPNDPSNTQNFGFLLDFTTDTVQFINASLSTVFYTYNVGGANTDWNDLKTGAKSCRFGISLFNEDDLGMVVYQQGDANWTGYYDTIAGNKQYYMGTATGGSYASSGGCTTFYTKAETNALVAGAGSVTPDSTDTFTNKTIDTANNTLVVAQADVTNLTTDLADKSTASKVETLINKTLDADGTGNVITNIDNANVKVGANIDAVKIGTGLVSNTEFNYLDGLTSSIQGQMNNKPDFTGSRLNDIDGTNEDLWTVGPIPTNELLSGFSKIEMYSHGVIPANSKLEMTWNPASFGALQLNRNIGLFDPGGAAILGSTSLILDAPGLVQLQSSGNGVLVNGAGGDITLTANPINDVVVTNGKVKMNAGVESVMESEASMTIKCTGTVPVFPTMKLDSTYNVQLDATNQVISKNHLTGGVASYVVTENDRRFYTSFHELFVTAGQIVDFMPWATANVYAARGIYVHSFELFVGLGVQLVPFIQKDNFDISKLGDPVNNKGVRIYMVRSDDLGVSFENMEAGNPLYQGKPNNVRCEFGGDGAWTGKFIQCNIKWIAK